MKGAGDVEASDAFGQGVEISDGDDPFDGTDFGDFGDGSEPQTEPAVEADAPADTAGLPVVDREGQPVVPDAASAESAQAPAAEPAPAAPQAAPAPQEAAQAAVHPPPPVTPPPGPSDPAAEAAAYEERHAAPAAAAPPPPPPAPEPVSPESPGVREPEPAPEPDPTTGASGTGDTASAEPTGDGGGDKTTASQSSNGTTEVAPEPEETTDKRGRRVKRKYLILRVIGPGKFEQVAWYEKGGKMCAKSEEGARKQTVALARDTDEALKIGYVACGRPQDGVMLVTVAAANFQAKKIRPKPPEPARERLEIV